MEQEEIIIEINNKTGDEKKYKKGQFLGKGGFASVYELTNLQDNKKFAAKFIAKSSLTKEKHKQKLLSEIKIHKSLNHQNIVSFKHVFEDKNNVYILLDVCENKSLSDLLRRRKNFSDREIQQFLYQILNAINYLHNNLIIHRDLKLGNIFITDKMELKVGDFGLAAHLQTYDERRKTMCGTPNYLAPEIFDKINGYSFQVDLWSIGIILYTLYYGKPPFESQDVKETYKKVKAGVIFFPDNKIINQQAKNLIQCLLTKNPQDRYTIEQVLQHEFMQFQNEIKTLPMKIFLKTTTQHKSVEKKQTLKEKTFVLNRESSQNVRSDSYNKKINQTRNQSIKEDTGIQIVKWLDYTSKYGIGFLLNNGQLGVYFNDQTKILFTSYIKDKFIYIQKIQNEQIIIEYSMKKYPSDIEKKIKLLKYFQNYLMGENFSLKEYDTQVFLKKWKKTNNAILFRLSNKIIQTIFKDNTQILIQPQNKTLIFVDKKQEKHTYLLNQIQQSDNQQMVKRFKYTKEIIYSMVDNDKLIQNNEQNKSPTKSIKNQIFVQQL